jgi:hypothetical protein
VEDIRFDDKSYQAKVILAAKWDAIKAIPKIWRKRNKIQSARKVSVMAIWRVLDKRLSLTKK